MSKNGTPTYFKINNGPSRRRRPSGLRDDILGILAMVCIAAGIVTILTSLPVFH